jgi:hypothetical protein
MLSDKLYLDLKSNVNNILICIGSLLIIGLVTYTEKDLYEAFIVPASIFVFCLSVVLIYDVIHMLLNRAKPTPVLIALLVFTCGMYILMNIGAGIPNKNLAGLLFISFWVSLVFIGYTKYMKHWG